MTDLLDTIIASILSPPIMFFVMGVVATLARSDLKIPESVGTSLGIFLLAAIGLRSGVGIAEVGIKAALLPAFSAVVLGVLIALVGYSILRSILKIDPANAGCIAGHFGAVSAATLAIVLAYVDRFDIYYEPFVPALYPFMDSAALIAGIVLARVGMSKQISSNTQSGISISQIIQEAVSGKGVFLLFGGLLIGYIAGAEGTKKIMPFYDTMFNGILTLFLLDIGLAAGKRLREFKIVGPSIIIYAMVMVPINGLAGIMVGTLIGLSVGGTLIFATMAASASYISAPAVMRAALPTSNPSLALIASLLVAFPFNATVGIPVYNYLAEVFARIM